MSFSNNSAVTRNVTGGLFFLFFKPTVFTLGHYSALEPFPWVSSREICLHFCMCWHSVYCIADNSLYNFIIQLIVDGMLIMSTLLHICCFYLRYLPYFFTVYPVYNLTEYLLYYSWLLLTKTLLCRCCCNVWISIYLSICLSIYCVTLDNCVSCCGFVLYKFYNKSSVNLYVIQMQEITFIDVTEHLICIRYISLDMCSHLIFL